MSRIEKSGCIFIVSCRVKHTPTDVPEIVVLGNYHQDVLMNNHSGIIPEFIPSNGNKQPVLNRPMDKQKGIFVRWNILSKSEETPDTRKNMHVSHRYDDDVMMIGRHETKAN